MFVSAAVKYETKMDEFKQNENGQLLSQFGPPVGRSMHTEQSVGRSFIPNRLTFIILQSNPPIKDIYGALCTTTIR